MTFANPTSFSPVLSSPPSPELKIHFIHVGYGDAIIIQVPEGGNILIDCGKSETSAGLLMALAELNIQCINMLILTHFHDDHIGALPTILENFIPNSSDARGEIFIPFELKDTEIEPEIAALIDPLKKYPLQIVRQGEILVKTDSLQIKVLHPKTLSGNQNEDSLVLKMTHGKITFLLMADAGLSTQKKLYEDYGNRLRCDLIKIPHHANDNALFGPFLECANPKTAILTIGENGYQAPNANVLAAYQQQCKTLFRTDQQGNITATSDGHTLHIASGWT